MTFKKAARIVGHTTNRPVSQIVEAAMVVITNDGEEDLLAHLNACHAVECVLAEFELIEALAAEQLH